MADRKRIKHPYMEYYEPELDEVIVELSVSGLIPEKKSANKHDVKNGVADVFFTEQGFDFIASLTTGKDGKESEEWRHIVRRLPGRVNRLDSKWSVEKGKVIISLRKESFTSWLPAFRERGLDQWSSSEEDETKKNEKKTRNTLGGKNYLVVDSSSSLSEDQLSTPHSVENVARNLEKLEMGKKAQK